MLVGQVGDEILSLARLPPPPAGFLRHLGGQDLSVVPTVVSKQPSLVTVKAKILAN